MLALDYRWGLLFGSLFSPMSSFVMFHCVLCFCWCLHSGRGSLLGSCFMNLCLGHQQGLCILMKSGPFVWVIVFSNVNFLMKVSFANNCLKCLRWALGRFCCLCHFCLQCEHSLVRHYECSFWNVWNRLWVGFIVWVIVFFNGNIYNYFIAALVV
jgi:hypothetical protein